MKKNCKYFILGILLIIGYGGFIFIQGRDDKVGHDPQITVPQTPLTVSVTSEESVLLQDVSASDKEDGDLTSQMFIESISAFQENQTRTITYAVFDSDDNLSRATRRIRYSDYEAPRITLNQALCISYNDYNVQLQDYVGAASSVDRDLSAKVSVGSESQGDDGYYATFSVMDSCGTTSSLRLRIDTLWDDPSMTIELSDYLIYVERGTDIDPQDYIERVSDRGIEDDDLIDEVTVQDDYDADKEGTYEFIYRINRSNGDYGITKLVVIVE